MTIPKVNNRVRVARYQNKDETGWGGCAWRGASKYVLPTKEGPGETTVLTATP